MSTTQYWLKDAVHFFSMEHKIGSTLTVEEFGNWLIRNNFIDEPKSKSTSSPYWIKFVKDRNAIRGRMNRFASSDSFAEEGEDPYSIELVGHNNLEVLSAYDDIKKLAIQASNKIPKGLSIKIDTFKEKLKAIIENDGKSSPEYKSVSRMIEDMIDAKNNIHSE